MPPRAHNNRMKKSFFAVIAACAALFPSAVPTFGYAAAEDVRIEAVAPQSVGSDHADRAYGEGGGKIPSQSGGRPLPIEEPASSVHKNSVLVSSFSTSFNRGADGRSYNLALAASNFCFLEVGEGEKLSFNGIVGLRTEARGYRRAKVIENGEYVVGVGGGVCQVSTTLYNAWIRAGLSAESVRAHSLPSSYCELSQDATVSDAIDMVLVNDGDGPVYVDAEIDGGTLTFRIYGTKRSDRYEFRTEIEAVIAPTEELIEFVPALDGKDHEVVRAAKNGYRSHLLRLTYRDGVLAEKKILRRDVYRAVPAKILVAENSD